MILILGIVAAAVLIKVIPDGLTNTVQASTSLLRLCQILEYWAAPGGVQCDFSHNKLF
jgi:hypothetical protein